MWCHDIQPYVTMTRGKCKLAAGPSETHSSFHFSYFCFSLIPHWMDQSPKVNRHLVMPECQRDLSREREIKREPGICTTPSGSALRLIFTGPILGGHL